MYVCFYKGCSLPALVVRYDTRRPEQSFSDVPGHCAIIIGETLYEMISTGWNARIALPEDRMWSVDLQELDEVSAKITALSWRRTRYGWWVDALIGLSRVIPARWLLTTRGVQKPICSAFVKRVLEAAGWNCPHWLAGQFVPESPNDLWWAVRPKVL